MSNTSFKNSFLSTPILLIIFNRPDVTIKVFETIRKAKPQILYVASDGPRKEKIEENKIVMQTRKIATAVDWPCKVKTLFRSKNLGCKYSVSGAIDWFFENEEQGIILEDDCLPHQDFFYYCETLLNYYKKNNKISIISGSNFKKKDKNNIESYYFSKYFCLWGWASWRRTWNCYDRDISFWPSWKYSDDWNERFDDKTQREYWNKLFELTHLNKIDTWDYQLLASIWKNNGLAIIPKSNLISNIGFGKNATFNKDKISRLSNVPVKEIGELVHPSKISQNQNKDREVFDIFFEGYNLRMPWIFFGSLRKKIGYLLRKISFYNVKY